MAHTRHWKQRWDPHADFVFAKRLRMGDNPRKPFVLPGEPVTKKMREKMGLHRLRRWWEAGVIAIADWEPPRRNRRSATEPHVRKLGGPWFEVTLPGQDAERVRGKEAAELLVAGWLEAQEQDDEPEQPQGDDGERVNDNDAEAQTGTIEQPDSDSEPEGDDPGDDQHDDADPADDQEQGDEPEQDGEDGEPEDADEQPEPEEDDGEDEDEPKD